MDSAQIRKAGSLNIAAILLFVPGVVLLALAWAVWKRWGIIGKTKSINFAERKVQKLRGLFEGRYF